MAAWGLIFLSPVSEHRWDGTQHILDAWAPLRTTEKKKEKKKKITQGIASTEEDPWKSRQTPERRDHEILKKKIT